MVNAQEVPIKKEQIWFSGYALKINMAIKYITVIRKR